MKAKIIFQNTHRLNQTQVETLYASVGWSAYTAEPKKLMKSLAQSLTVFSAWHDEELVGLIRVVGDGLTIIYIQDILVKPTYQRQGIGRELMTKVLETYPDVRQKVLMTEEAPDVRAFYESFGFHSCDQGQAVAFGMFH